MPPTRNPPKTQELACTHKCQMMMMTHELKLKNKTPTNPHTHPLSSLAAVGTRIANGTHAAAKRHGRNVQEFTLKFQ